MRHTLHTFALLVAAAIAFGLLAPAPAHAVFPCSGAPNEQMVGVDKSNPSVHVPLCVTVGEAAPPAPAVETHAAYAWHTDGADVWVDGSYTGPNNAGPATALARCNQAMGGGCVSGGTWANSTMAFYRSSRGEIYSGWTHDRNAVKKVEADCRGQDKLPCERIFRLGSGTRERFPGPEARKRYLVAAWVKGAEGYDNKLYIASGEPTYGAAESKAIGACRAANPQRECQVKDYTGNGVLQVYLVGDSHSAVAENTPARAKKAAQAWCKHHKGKCALQTVYDARKPGQFVFDFAAAAAARSGSK